MWEVPGRKMHFPSIICHEMSDNAQSGFLCERPWLNYFITNLMHVCHMNLYFNFKIILQG